MTGTIVENTTIEGKCAPEEALEPLDFSTADDLIDMADLEALERFRLVSRHTFLSSCEIPELRQLQKQILNNDYRTLNSLKKHCPDNYQTLALNFGWFPQDETETLKIVRNIIDMLKESAPKVSGKLAPLVAVLEAQEDEEIPPIEHAAEGLKWLRFKHSDFTIITAWLQRFLYLNYVPEIFEFPGNVPEEIVNEVFSETPDSDLLKELNLEEIYVDEDDVEIVV